jgi:hypothetical protein
MIPSLRATSLRTLRVGARGFAGHWESMAQQIPAAKKDEFNAIVSDMRKAKVRRCSLARAMRERALPVPPPLWVRECGGESSRSGRAAARWRRWCDAAAVAAVVRPRRATPWAHCPRSLLVTRPPPVPHTPLLTFIYNR